MTWDELFCSPEMGTEKTDGGRPVRAVNSKRSYDEVQVPEEHHDDGRLTKLRKQSVKSDVSGHVHCNRKD